MLQKMALKLSGGSVTLSVAVLAIVWTIRSVRDKRRRHRESPSVPLNSSSKYFAELSLEAIALLVHLDAIPYCFIDVRSTAEAAAAPLATWVAPAVNIPEPQLQTGLKQPASWRSFTAASSSLLAAQDTASHHHAAAPTPADATQHHQQQQHLTDLQLPTKHHLLLLLADSEEQQQAAASRAAAAGFNRVAVPSCGIEQLLNVQLLGGSSISRDQQVTAAAAAAAVQCPVIHADALAVLLGLAPLPDAVWQLLLAGQQQQQQAAPTQQRVSGRSPRHSRNNSGSMLAVAGEAVDGTAAAAGMASSTAHQQRLLLVDVRRHDERALYGAIPGAHHIPAAELASALQLQPSTFRRRYHFEPPDRAIDVLVLHSRASSRAQWAAQICLDAGCKYVFVYPEGVLGWHFGPGVQPYTAYQQGGKPPVPDMPVQHEPHVASGVMEVQQLGLVQLLMQQHGVVT